jgi:hypothetical protein
MRKDSDCYRPTVRYDSRFKDYVEELFHCTDLDRNQLLRAALLFFGSEGKGKEFLTSHLLIGKTLPPPLLESCPEYGLWQGSAAQKVEGERDVKEIEATPTQPLEGGTSDEIIIGGEYSKPIIIDTRGAGGGIHLDGRERETPRPEREVRPGVRIIGRGVRHELGANKVPAAEGV